MSRALCLCATVSFVRAFVPSARSWAPRTVVSMAATQDELKKQVGFQAIDDYVESGMVVGLGTGSTAAFAVERVGELLPPEEVLGRAPQRRVRWLRVRCQLRPSTTRVSAIATSGGHAAWASYAARAV